MRSCIDAMHIVAHSRSGHHLLPCFTTYPLLSFDSWANLLNRSTFEQDVPGIPDKNYPISHPAIYVFARCITTRRETSLVLSFNHPRDYQLSYHPLPPVRINEHELTHSLSNVETTLPVTLSAAAQDRKQSGRILMDYTCRHRLLRVRGPLISPIIVYVRRINTVFY